MSYIDTIDLNNTSQTSWGRTRHSSTKSTQNLIDEWFNTDAEHADEEDPSEMLLKSMEQVEKDIKERNTSPAFRTAEEVNKWLDEQGV